MRAQMTDTDLHQRKNNILRCVCERGAAWEAALSPMRQGRYLSPCVGEPLGERECVTSSRGNVDHRYIRESALLQYFGIHDRFAPTGGSVTTVPTDYDEELEESIPSFTGNCIRVSYTSEVLQESTAS